jgi:CHAT domain-containing protein/tetratricopeptide (TPR) repeat protein
MWLIRRPAPPIPSGSPAAQTEPADLVRLRGAGYQLYLAQRYAEAAETYERGYRESLERRLTWPALRFLINLAGCRFALSRYQEAAELYLEARRLARPMRPAEELAIISVNLAGIYLQMGDAAAAAQAAEEGIRDLRGHSKVFFQARLLGQLGNARGWLGQPEQALSILRQSHWEADRADDVPVLAQCQDYAGGIFLRRGDLASAEAAFLNAYLVRKLRKPDEVHYSHANLGRLRLAQGDYRSAETLFDLALAKARSAPSLVQVWALYHGRGVARRAQGKHQEALADFAAAVDLARRWRADAVAADALRIRADVGLDEVYQAYIGAAAGAALGGAGSELARRAFAAAEQRRAASLRERWNAASELRDRLPEEYWPTLGQLQAAEVAALRDPSSPAAARASQLRLRLVEMETQSGAPRPLPGRGNDLGFSRAVQQRLGPSDALFSFELGERESYLWAVTRTEFALRALGPQQALISLVSRFRDAVRLGRPEAVDAGRRLYASLFGGLGASVVTKEHWIVVLDDALFEAPLAAAVTAIRGGRPVYLAESHSLLVIPSAAALLEARVVERRPGRTQFVGLGDPVYNRADPRWGGRPAAGWRWPLVLTARASSSPPPDLELPRLPGSAAEIHGCARVWGEGETLLLEGPAASRRRLAEALNHRPAVLHLATHVLTPPDRRDGAMIVLSLRPSGDPEVLTTAEISSLGAARLVVLSGCSSGTGVSLPGAGLIGLTRAWLAAGAERVVTSLWSTPDDSGEIFLSFYRHIKENPREAAASIRRAQLEMLHSGGWRQDPRHWAAYVVAGKG